MNNTNTAGCAETVDPRHAPSNDHFPAADKNAHRILRLRFQHSAIRDVKGIAARAQQAPTSYLRAAFRVAP